MNQSFTKPIFFSKIEACFKYFSPKTRMKIDEKSLSLVFFQLEWGLQMNRNKCKSSQ